MATLNKPGPLAQVGTVALVLVDEVHTIGEERGATLEVILTRMKMVSRSAEVRLRLILTALNPKKRVCSIVLSFLQSPRSSPVQNVIEAGVQVPCSLCRDSMLFDCAKWVIAGITEHHCSRSMVTMLLI